MGSSLRRCGAGLMAGEREENVVQRRPADPEVVGGPLLVHALGQVVQQADKLEVLAAREHLVDRGVLTCEPDPR
jgi:hypothetical protein